MLSLYSASVSKASQAPLQFPKWYSKQTLYFPASTFSSDKLKLQFLKLYNPFIKSNKIYTVFPLV